MMVRETLELWLGWWRDVMLTAGTSVGGDGRETGPLLITNINRVEQIRTAAALYGLETASAAVRAIQQTLWRLERNANTRLAVEALMLDLPFD